MTSGVYKSIDEDSEEDGLRLVYMRVTFKKIGEIDTAKECFAAEVVIQSKWREPKLDGLSQRELKNVNFDALWSPKLYVSNLLSESRDVSSNIVVFPDKDNKASILNQRKLKGIFLENLELQEFPFDVQDITLTVTSELLHKDVKFMVDPDEQSVVDVRSFVDEQEWKLRTEVRIEDGELEDVVVGKKSLGGKHPFMNFKCTAERRYEYFVWNVIVIMIFICLMSFTTFSVDYKLPQNRLQLTFILLLTTIAFKTNINNSLPKISYLTYMDIYILGSWVIQCLMCAWHAIVGNLLNPGDGAFWTDKGFLIGFAVLYFLFLFAYTILVMHKLKSKRRRIMSGLPASKAQLRATAKTPETKKLTGKTPFTRYKSLDETINMENPNSSGNNNNNNNNNIGNNNNKNTRNKNDAEDNDDDYDGAVRNNF